MQKEVQDDNRVLMNSRTVQQMSCKRLTGWVESAAAMLWCTISPGRMKRLQCDLVALWNDLPRYIANHYDTLVNSSSG